MDTILKNSKLNNIFAMIAALVLAVSFSLTSVFAQGVPEGSVTVNNVEKGATVNLYQIAEVNWNSTADQPVDPMYKWTDSVNNFIKDNEQVYGSYRDEHGFVTNVFEFIPAADEKTFLEDVFNNAALGNAAYTETNSSEGTTIKIDGVKAGLYLIQVVKPAGSQTKLTYQITTAALLPTFSGTQWIVNNATVNEKSIPSGSTKVVTNDDNKVVVGDTVDYKITTTVPSYMDGSASYTFKVQDTLGTGLTLDADSIQINGKPLSDDVATFSQDTNGNSFTLVFNPNYVQSNPGKSIEITYLATVNNNIYGTALENTASIITNDSTEEVKANVYTYFIKVKKVDGINKALQGAQFNLTNESDSATPLKFSKVVGYNGIYTYDPKGTIIDLTTNKSGFIVVQGLNTGTYTLTEIKAPDGYVLPANPNVTITLMDDGKGDGILDQGSGAAGSIVATNINDSQDDNYLEFGVVNKTSSESGFILPNTGGMGTLIFTVGGILLMAGAVIIYVISKKKA